jgi:D-amino-acid dehydrogenase
VKVVVIGAGLIGLTAAYSLRKRGHEVTVIERQEGPGRETSFANGTLLTPSMPEPWNTPGCWRVLLSSLGRTDAPLQLRLRALPSLTGWGLKFLANSKPEAFERNTLSNLRLALYSRQLLASLRRETNIHYGAAARGSLRVFRSAEAMSKTLAAAERLAADGLIFRRLSRSETVELEPALAPIAEELTGAIHYGDDESGDAYHFCVALADYLRARGVTFSLGTSVSMFEVRLGCVAAARCTGQRFTGEHYVIAAGSYSAPLLRPLGIHLPVRPAKGYSVTFQASQHALGIPIVDDDMHAAVVPVGAAIRVAGTAEFAGFDLMLRPDRVRNLTNLAQQLLPQAQLDAATARPWCGLRPMSPDGVPIIGATPIPNLWVNTGHGHLGWTMAAGSGDLLAKLMSGESAAIDPAPYSPRRFAELS